MTVNDTAIAWTNVTWNPATGCEKISEGCKFCYAEQLAEQKRGTSAFPTGFDLKLRPHKLNDPKKLKEPSLIFVNSMSDLFWNQISDAYRDQVLDTIEATPQHQYQVLTKRPENMLRYSKRRALPSNFWAGTTIENQRWFDRRMPILLEVKAEIRFVSAEPLIGPIVGDWSGIRWVITGGESGNHIARGQNADRALVHRVDGRWVPVTEREDWVRKIRDDVKEAGAALFHKQWGGPRPDSGGRMLDGRTWDEFPRLPKGGGVNYRLEGKSTTLGLRFADGQAGKKDKAHP